jgi:cell division septum initiation protein DivIVA
MTPRQQAFLDRVKDRLENPPVLVLTPEQIAEKEAWDALSRADKTITQFKRARLSLLRQSIQTIKSNWENIWENTSATPTEMMAAMGKEAVSIFQSSAEYTQTIYNIGQTMEPIITIDAKYLSAKFPYTANEDGSITLEGE